MNKEVRLILSSALLYGISIPVSKIILENGVSAGMIAAFTYLGAGIGLLIYNLFNRLALNKIIEKPLTRKELPYAACMIILDITAILLLMHGIAKSSAASASLLSSCEIAASALIAFIFFKEHISKNLWKAIVLIIAAGALLSYEGAESLNFSAGSLLVIAAYISWGAENNCTKMMSSRNAQEITMIKGLFSGAGSLVIAFLSGETMPEAPMLAAILITGFLSYGLSVVLYIKSQYYAGAAKTAAYFASAPFFGTVCSLLILGEIPDLKFYAALAVMAIAAVFSAKDYIKTSV